MPVNIEFDLVVNKAILIISFLCVYIVCNLPFGIAGIVLAILYRDSCRLLSVWTLIYNIYIIVSPLLSLPFVCVQKQFTKVFTIVQYSIITITSIALLIWGIFVVYYSNQQGDRCNEGGRYNPLWIFDVISLSIGFV